MAAQNPVGGEKRTKDATGPRFSRGHFSFEVYLCVTRVGLSEKGAGRG